MAKDASAPTPDAPTADVLTTEYSRHTDRSVGICSLAVDKAGNEFHAAVNNNGFNSWVVVTKRTGGADVASWTVNAGPLPSAGVNKADGVSIAIVRLADGRVVIRGLVTSHFTDASLGRPYIRGGFELFNTGAVYEPENPTHGDRAEPVAAAADGGGMTAEEARAVIREELNRALDASSTSTRIKNSAKRAIEETSVLREENVHTSPGLYSRLKDTIYEVLTTNWPDKFPRS